LTALHREPDRPRYDPVAEAQPRVGVLALQGAFREHLATLRGLGVEAEPLRSAQELEQCSAVVLPGGESTTMDKLLRKFGLRDPLARRIAEGMPVLATCAGVILLADEVLDGLPDQESMHLLPARVRRNAYGRQPDSFETDLEVSGLETPFHAVFIRAPMIETVGEGVEVLASVEGHPVAIRSGNIVGLAFHPELTADDRIHRLFLDSVVKGTLR
jgi:5'-phosphate synthase pdxT subunit